MKKTTWRSLLLIAIMSEGPGYASSSSRCVLGL
jgi:hypothetical protein